MKSINIRLTETMIQDIKEVSNIYNISNSELIRKGIEIILQNKKNEAYYKLTANIAEGTEKETREIIERLNQYSEKDLEVVEVESVVIE